MFLVRVTPLECAGVSPGWLRWAQHNKPELPTGQPRQRTRLLLLTRTKNAAQTKTSPPGTSLPSPEPIASASPSPAPASASEDQDEQDTSGHDGNPLPTLFNSTFALYRVSPLYLGQDRLDRTRLQTLSKRLRDTLVGDVVRGVQVGLAGSSSEDATLGRAGALGGVEWRWVPLRKLLPRRSGGGSQGQARRRREREGSAELGSREEDADDNNENSESDDDEERNTDARALSVELRYENNTFAACLLPRLYKDDSSDGAETAAAATSQWSTHNEASTNLVADQKQFLHLPLLLLRMPTPLRSVLNDFLARTFDVRIRPLRLGTRPLVSSWASWHTNAGVSGSGRGLVKDVVLSLGFHVLEEPTEATKQQQKDSSEGVDATKNSGNNHNTTSKTTTTKSLGLKAIDIIVPAEEVRRFIRAGQQAIQDRDDETASGNNRRKGKRKAGEQPSSEKTMSPSRRRKLAGGKDDEGWEWRQVQDEEMHEPFTEALGLYLVRHLALNMFHPSVRILRIACEGFVLSEGGRIKVFMPPAEDGSKSAWKLLDGLVERARGRDWGSVPTIPGL
ncbi:uncharacterized protein PG986_005177 [Apiospora aurea]|uniref:Siroheme synthase n=1 Tax=Apiospora aurea TaxID=335848 RepID=A0ABR1QGT2_9PEZI